MTQFGSVTPPPREGLPGKKPGPLLVAFPNVYEARYDRPFDSLRRTEACRESYFEAPMYSTVVRRLATAPPKPADEITVARWLARVPTYASIADVLPRSSCCPLTLHCCTLVFFQFARMYTMPEPWGKSTFV